MLVHNTFDVTQKVHRLETNWIVMHDSADRHTLIDQSANGVSIIRCRQNESIQCFCLCNNFRLDAAIISDNQAGNIKSKNFFESIKASIASENNVACLYNLFCLCNAASQYSDVAFDNLIFISGDQYFRFCCLNDVTITNAHISKTLKTKLKEVTLCQVAG